MTTSENPFLHFGYLGSAWSCWQQQCTGFRQLVYEINWRVQWGCTSIGNQSRQMWRTQLSPPILACSLTSYVPQLPSNLNRTVHSTHKCESCTLGLLQNVWMNHTIFSKWYWSIPLGVWAAQAIYPCIGSLALQLNALPVTTDWTAPHNCCRLIHLHHIQPSQLSHQLSIFIQTGNNSYFHLQCSPAKSNFPRIFKH